MKVTINASVLREWMQKRGKRAEDIASLSGLSYATVLSALRKHPVSFGTLGALCSVTDLPQSLLVDKRKQSRASKNAAHKVAARNKAIS